MSHHSISTLQYTKSSGAFLSRRVLSGWILAAADPRGLYDDLKWPFKTMLELCLGIGIPWYFPDGQVALLWINVFENFRPKFSFAWALANKDRLEQLPQHILRSVLMSSSGPGQHLHDRMMREIIKLKGDVVVINKGVGLSDWADNIQAGAAAVGIRIKPENLYGVDMVQFDTRVVMCDPEELSGDVGIADVVGSALGCLRCPRRFIGDILTLLFRDAKNGALVILAEDTSARDRMELARVFFRHLELLQMASDLEYIETTDGCLTFCCRKIQETIAPEVYEAASQQITNVLTARAREFRVSVGAGEEDMPLLCDNGAKTCSAAWAGVYLIAQTSPSEGSPKRPKAPQFLHPYYAGGSINMASRAPDSCNERNKKMDSSMRSGEYTSCFSCQICIPQLANCHSPSTCSSLSCIMQRQCKSIFFGLVTC